MLAPMTLLLVRHMESTGDGPDPMLSEKGREQLRALQSALERYPISFVYSSDLWRAVEPAQAIARQFGVPHQAVPALREIRKGQEFPRPRSVSGSQPTGPDTEMEDTAAFESRVAQAIQAIVARHEHCHIVVLTHSGTMRAALRHLLQMPLSPFDLPSVAPGALVILKRDAAGRWQSVQETWLTSPL